MPQHKELSILPLVLPPIPTNIPPELRTYLQQLQDAIQGDRNAQSQLNLRSGLTSFDDTENSGYFRGFKNGVPVDIVGSRATEKYFAFDGSDLNIGYETELKGADHFNNNSTYVGDVFMGGVSGYDTTGTGGGSATYSATGGYAEVSVDGTSGAVGEIVKTIRYNTVGGITKGSTTGNANFDGLSRFKATVGIVSLNATNLNFRVGVGAISTGTAAPSNWVTGGIGMKIKNGRFYAYSIDGTSRSLGSSSAETDYDTGVSASPGTYQFAIEGSSVYINGTEYVTTFDTPNASWTGNDYFVLHAENTGSSGTTTARCSQWKVN